MVTILPRVFHPSTLSSFKDRRQSASANFTAVQDRSSERGRRRGANNASCLRLFLLSNKAGVSRQMQLMANCGLISGIYTAISTFKRSTVLVNGDMETWRHGDMVTWRRKRRVPTMGFASVYMLSFSRFFWLIHCLLQAFYVTNELLISKYSNPNTFEVTEDKLPGALLSEVHRFVYNVGTELLWCSVWTNPPNFLIRLVIQYFGLVGIIGFLDFV